MIGEHSGFPQADARTAALLVCGELSKEGIAVGEPVFRGPDSASIYRLGLHRLGQKILVRLSHENPIGTVLIERQIQLGSIEEMVSAAPRLVDALVHRKSLASTVDMESVVEQEARMHRKIPGESFWDIGLLGTFALITDADMIAKPGYSLGWYHETPSYAVGTELWGAGGEDNEGDSFHFFSLGNRRVATSSTSRTFRPMWAVGSPISGPVMNKQYRGGIRGGTGGRGTGNRKMEMVLEAMQWAE